MSATIKWSYSSVNTFRECNRKFYFSNILATHGRKEPLRRKAYELKKMQNLKMWAGAVVDKFMETVIIPAIAQKKNLDFNELEFQIVKLAQEQFLFSKHKLYLDPSQKKGEVDSLFCILDIDEIGAPFSETDLAEAYESMRVAIRNIPLMKMSDGKLLLDFLKGCNSLTPNVNNWEVLIEKARLKPQMDLLALFNWKPVVMDWKLSSSYVSDYARQLIICGITVYLKRLEKTDKKPWGFNEIRLFEVNLLKGLVREHLFTEDRVNDVMSYIILTADDIQLVTQNDGVSIADFDMTDDETYCMRCSFQTLCSHLLVNKLNYDEKLYIKSIPVRQPA